MWWPFIQSFKIPAVWPAAGDVGSKETTEFFSYMPEFPD